MTENSDSFSDDGFRDPVVLALLLVSWAITIFMIIVTLVVILRCSKRRTKHRHRLVDRGSAERAYGNKLKNDKRKAAQSVSGSKSPESAREKYDVKRNPVGNSKDAEVCQIHSEANSKTPLNQRDSTEKCFADKSDDRTYPSQLQMERADLSAGRTRSRQQNSTTTESGQERQSGRKKKTFARIKDMVDALSMTGHPPTPERKTERVDEVNQIEPTQPSTMSELQKSRKKPR